MPVGAGELLPAGAPTRRAALRLVDEVGLEPAAREAESRLDGIRQTRQQVVGRDETVDDHRDVVLVLLLERGRVGQLHDLPVDDRSRIPGCRQLLEEVY